MKISVSTEWLNNNINKKNLIIIDATWSLPDEKIDSYKEFLREHIPKSHFIDIDNMSDKSINLPHMLPNTRKFQTYINLFGINKDSIIIIYDAKGIFSSPRLWWMFKYFGFSKVYILDGGLKKWKEEKRILTNKIDKINKGNKEKFKVKIFKRYLSNKEDVINSIKENTSTIIDARSKNRYLGIEKEKRKNLKSGKIPKSKNLYWKKLINENGTFKTNKKLKILFNQLKLKKNNHIITTCGSGITACILKISLAKLNFTNVSVYDGSWAEWGMKK